MRALQRHWDGGRLNASVALLGRDRAPFVPDSFWHMIPHTDGVMRDVWIDRADDPEAWRSVVEADGVVVTQWDDGDPDPAYGRMLPTSGASAPSIVKAMLDAADIREGQHVFEIGTGTGYTAALLKDRVGASGSVLTVEVDPDVADDARNRLEAAKVDAEVVCGDACTPGGMEALRSGLRRRTFDRVHATCALREIPAEWLTVCPNGKIMLPRTTAFSPNADHVITLNVRNGIGSGRFGAAVAFMKARAQRPAMWDDWPDIDEPVPMPLGLDWQQLDAPLAASAVFVLGLLLPGVEHHASGDPADGHRDLWLEGDGKIALIRYGQGQPTSAAGDGRLVSRYVGAVRWWFRHGQPTVSGFGLSVRPPHGVLRYAVQNVWLGSPRRRVRV